jgi:pyruvate kinase
VPLIQKRLVETCILHAKPVIIATQMMESMIVDSMPTRAEITDVANAVLDGADAVMLSAETSVGKYPCKVIEIMGSIISDIESDRRAYYKGVKPDSSSPSFASDEICFTAVRMSDHLKAKAIIAMTKSGYTGFFFTIDDGPVDWRCTTVFRQQGAMQVDGAHGWHVPNQFGEHPEGHNNLNIGI